MRVTNQLATQRAIASVTESRAQLERALERATTGKRFSTASEDPSATLGIMQNEAQLRARVQYQRNIGIATSRVNLEDDVLDRLTVLMTRAKELAVSQASDTANPATRAATAREVNQLLSDAVQLSATRINGEYLFSGIRTDAAPFTVDSSGAIHTFQVADPAPTGARSVEIASGQRFVANHDALDIFGDDTSGPLAALRDLAAAMVGGDGGDIAAAAPALDEAMARFQSLIAETGARANQLQSVHLTHTTIKVDLEASISDMRDLELEVAITELASRQTAYQAAMAATARISSLTLTDYLR